MTIHFAAFFFNRFDQRQAGVAEAADRRLAQAVITAANQRSQEVRPRSSQLIESVPHRMKSDGISLCFALIRENFPPQDGRGGPSVR